MCPMVLWLTGEILCETCRKMAEDISGEKSDLYGWVQGLRFTLAASPRVNHLFQTIGRSISPSDALVS